jgi:hypothetical protein
MTGTLPGREHVLHLVQPPLEAAEDLLAGGLVGRPVQRLAGRCHEPVGAATRRSTSLHWGPIQLV